MCVTSPNKKSKTKVFTEAESQSLNPERNKKKRKTFPAVRQFMSFKRQIVEEINRVMDKSTFHLTSVLRARLRTLSPSPPSRSLQKSNMSVCFWLWGLRWHSLLGTLLAMSPGSINHGWLFRDYTINYTMGHDISTIRNTQVPLAERLRFTESPRTAKSDTNQRWKCNQLLKQIAVKVFVISSQKGKLARNLWRRAILPGSNRRLNNKHWP